MPQEIELKLALTPEAAARLRRSPLLKGVRPERRQLSSIYYDTPDFELMRAGIALRVRQVGRRWVQTLKAEAQSVGALTARPEWEVPVPGREPRVALLPPEAQARLAPEWIERLQPCFATEFQRSTWQLGTGTERLELALDQGEIRSGEACMPICEIELELLAGGPAQLFDTALALLGSAPLRIEPRSKAQRGYQLAGAIQLAPSKARLPAMRADAPAIHAWQTLLAAALTQIAANAPGLLEAEDPEYLHQMRIGLRRLGVAVRMAPGLGLEAPDWAPELPWLLDELGPARDWDVFVTETLPALRPEHGARIAPLEKAAQAACAVGRSRARQAVDSDRFTRLVLEAGRTAATAEGEGEDAGAWAARQLKRRWKRLLRRGKAFDAQDAVARHRLRIAAKKLRYATEAFAGLYGKRAERALVHLAGLQDALGKANDRTVAARLLAELRLRGRAAITAAGFVEGWLAREARQADAGLKEAWREARKARPFRKIG